MGNFEQIIKIILLCLNYTAIELYFRTRLKNNCLIILGQNLQIKTKVIRWKFTDGQEGIGCVLLYSYVF